ncbi:MAG: DUF4346 domain-containing protein [Vulcanisaeta sp.]
MRFNYEVINDRSNIAVATLWSSVGQVKRVLGDALNMVSVIGNLYTIVGINYMLSTLARMNRIDTLIILGVDYNGVGDYVIKFFQDGSLPKLLIDRDVAEVLRATIKVVDLRSQFRASDWARIVEVIRENYRPNAGPVRPVFNVVVQESEINEWAYPLAGALIYERDTYRSWVKVVDLVLNYGFDKVGADGNGYREFLMPLIIIDSIGKAHPFRRLNENALRSFSSMSTGIRDDILNELRSNPHTLNAVVFGDDFMVQGVVSGDYYNQFIYLRSVDVLNDWCRNIYRWWSLARDVVNELNKEFNAWYSVGYLGILPFSARISRDELGKAEDFVRRNSSVFYEFVEDPRGNFLVMREGDSVVVEHRLPITNALHRRFSFRSLEEAYNALKNSNYFTNYSHAMYLGKELARAFLLRDYEQDKL